ncbi:MAG: flagellar hook-basal body complex protein FliE [Paracoccaceae bacterium]|jgi:flagellar hook-basal body complex protein FliE
MDVRSVTAALKYANARPATEATPQLDEGADGLKSMAMDFAQTMQQGESAAISAMSSDADPHALVLALAQTELAVETAVTVRNKVVEAYQEILRMPV